MFSRSTKTKVIWTVTKEHLDKVGPEKIADLVIDHGLHAIKCVYTDSIRQGLQDLRSALEKKIREERLSPDPAGHIPFLLSFVSRRALLDTGPTPLNLSEGEKLTIVIEVDQDFCSLNMHRGTKCLFPRVAVTSSDMLKKLDVGDRLSLSFGEAELRIEAVDSRTDSSIKVMVEVMTGGQAATGMVVSSPQIPHELFPLLDEDRRSLENRFDDLADYVIVNGLRDESEMQELKNYLQTDVDARTSRRHPSVPVGPTVRQAEAAVPPRFVIKIDSEAMLQSFTSLLGQVDGVYLSRSELGALVHPHNLPITQKEVISQCNRDAKLVMVASELMQSMQRNPNPTRAEVSDMANAVSDGADAFVLEQDVTEGPFANELAEVTIETIKKSEPKIAGKWGSVRFDTRTDDDAVAYGAISTAEQVGAKAIVCLTEGGYTAARLSSSRTPVEVIAMTYNLGIMRQLCLYRAVYPQRISGLTAFDRVLAEIKSALMEHCGLERGDRFVYLSLTASSISEKNSNFFTIQTFE